MSKTPVRVAVTGAAGQIGYAILFRIASGEMLGKDQPVILSLLEVPLEKPQQALQGVMMELQDCAFPLLVGMEAHGDPMTAFKDVDYALLIGSRPRGPGMERAELLAVNAQTVAVLFPHMRGVQVVRAWAGIEARLPDDIPVIGASSTHDGAWHAFGFSAHGFQLGPIVGSIMANLVTGRGTRFDLRPFAVTRFGAPGVTPATS